MRLVTVNIKVYSDYVCPFCFIAEKPLREAAEGKDVIIEWKPFELRPYPNDTLKPEEDYLQGTWKQSVYPLAEKYGVKLTLPKVSPQPYTHLAFEGFQYAKEQGKADDYTRRLFEAFFQEEKDIGEISVLSGLAEEIDLDKAVFKEALETRKYKDRHQQELEQASKENITAVPAFFIGNQKLTGLHTKESFEKVINQELEKPSFKMVEGMTCGPNGCF